MHAHSREEHRDAAELFLQEAVYRSRGDQTGAALLAAGNSEAGKCGLGTRPSVVLDLTPRAQELFEALWPRGVSAEVLQAMREVLEEWIRRQDTLDRKRNHFLKEFRGKHGFDSRVYDEQQRSAYEEGLTQVNEEINGARRAAAEGLLSAGEH